VLLVVGMLRRTRDPGADLQGVLQRGLMRRRWLRQRLEVLADDHNWRSLRIAGGTDMVATARPAGRWAALLSAVARRRLAALAISPMLALLGVVVVPALPAEAAFSCHYSFNPEQITVHDPGGTFNLSGLEFAGHYNGNTVVPLTNGVSAAGIEAQCLLRQAGFNPGTIDGVFGPNSQAAARGLQTSVNNNFHARITVDGLPGPQTWPWLRHLSQS
jgi:hypothetical protein